MAVRLEEVHLRSVTQIHFRLAKLLGEKVETSLEGGILSGHIPHSI